jgi:hypothetical protein
MSTHLDSSGGSRVLSSVQGIVGPGEDDTATTGANVPGCSLITVEDDDIGVVSECTTGDTC